MKRKNAIFFGAGMIPIPSANLLYFAYRIDNGEFVHPVSWALMLAVLLLGMSFVVYGFAFASKGEPK